MIEKISARTIAAGLLMVLGVVLGLLLLKSIYWTLMLFVMELMFATILDAPVSWLEKYKIPRPVGCLVCIFVILGIFVEVNLMIIPKASPEFKKLADQAPSVVSKLDENISNYFATMNVSEAFGIEYDEMKIKSFEAFKSNFGKIMASIRDKSIEHLESFSSLALGLIILWYLVVDPKPIEKGFLDPWSPTIKKRIRRVMLRIKKMLVCWAVALCCGCFAIFILTWLGLSIVKFPCAFFFAVFAGFMNIIPTLGPIISAIFPCLLSLLINPKMFLYVLIVYIVVQQLESNLITPLIMKKQLDVHPFILINCIIIFGYFFGVLGCFLAAPILASIAIIYEELYSKPRKLMMNN